MRSMYLSSLLSAAVLLVAMWPFSDGTSAVSPLTTAAIAVAPAAAAPLPDTPASEPVVQRVARKGTRNYDSGDSDIGTVPSTIMTNNEVTDRDLLKECMGTWDAATHITKSKWGEICERQIRERSEYRSEFKAQAPTAP